MTENAINQSKGRIEAVDLCVEFANGRDHLRAIEDLTFEVHPGEFVCLLGTSGCGKSTILNVAAGFIRPSSGKILLDGVEVGFPSPERGMVFQSHALFPWLNAIDNVAFGLKMKGYSKAERYKVARRYLDLVGLADFQTTYPGELSGGMEQRVGIARMLAVDPVVLLMDEPFGSLDAETRMRMQELLLQLWEETKKSVVFVTHDVEEAVLLADRIIVLTSRPGRVKEEIKVELGRPRKYEDVTSSVFVKIKERALRLIREESKENYDTQNLKDF